MDVELLSRIIRELIIDHDEVALPQVGTFVAEMVPASFSDRGYTVNPPYRRLSFVQRPGSDTLLVDFYAKANGMDLRMAESYLGDFLSELPVSAVSGPPERTPFSSCLRKTSTSIPTDSDLRAYRSNIYLRSRRRWKYPFPL